MKFKEIIEKLCNHDITKQDALEQITLIFDQFRKDKALEFTIEEIAFTSENNHGILKIKLPYQYSQIEHKIKKGDKVDVMILP